MKTVLIRTLFCLSMLLQAGAACAAGTEFTWQGELREGGQPASGSYDFEFRLFAAASGGSPLGPVRSLPAQSVTGGIYTALLDFGDQFTGDRRWLEIAVRRSGQPTFTTLLPRQALTAAPYAQHAEFVADNSIVGANIVDGAIGAADIDAGQVQRRVATNCAAGSSIRSIAQDGTVTCETDDGGAGGGGTVTSVVAGSGLNGGTITTSGTLSVNTSTIQARVTGECPNGQFIRQIQQTGQVACESVTATAGTVSSVNTGAGLSGGPITSTGTISIAGGGVTSLMIAPGAVGITQIRTDQVQRRVLGTCPVGEFLAGINADGTVLCSPLPTQFRRDLETTGDIGEFASIVIRADGRPMIAHIDRTNADLRLVDCLDSTCTNRTASTIDAQVEVQEVALAIRPDGSPLIAYGAGGLSVFDCNSPRCTSGTKRLLEPGTGESQGLSMALRADGRALISYLSPIRTEVRVYDCADADCSAGTARVLDPNVATSAGVGQRTAIGHEAGRLDTWVAYQDLTASDVRIVRCTVNDCSAFEAPLTIQATNVVGAWLSMALDASGVPMLSYYDATLSALKFARCQNSANCGTVDIRTPDNTGDVGTHASIDVRSDGFATITYHDVTNGGLMLHHCEDKTCGIGTTRSLETGSAAAPTGWYTALAVRNDGRPTIVFHDEASGDLKFRLCADPTCN